MKTTWLYGNHRGLGWGTKETQASPPYKTLDFEPEFECRKDVRQYWKNRKRITSKHDYFKVYKDFI